VHYIELSFVEITAAFALGGVAGWMINYLANVLPIKRRLVKPFCFVCGEELSWKQSIFYTKCPKCNTHARVREWLVQISMPIIALLLRSFPPGNISFENSFLLTVYFLLVLVIDVEHKLILNSISICGFFLALIIGYNIHGFSTTLFGGASGFLIMLALYYLGELFIKVLNKSKPDDRKITEVALGFGDVNLSGIIGLLLGWPGVAAGLLLAILLGGIISAGLILLSLIKKSYQPLVAIPYAPFLIISAYILLIL